jgi:hypothetical protein
MGHLYQHGREWVVQVLPQWSACAGEHRDGVSHPLERLTGTVHVYGDAFFATPRSEWAPRRSRRSGLSRQGSCGLSRRI